MRILHTGDTHIGYRQYGSDERRRDFLDAFERVVRDAIEDDVDVLVHAGDLFHSRNPRLEDVIPTIDLFRELRDAGIEVLAVVGNHERKRQDQWLDLLEGIDAVTRLGAEPVVIDGAAFYGVDYVPPSRIDDFDYDAFVPPTDTDEDVDHAFLALHGRFEPFPYGEWPLERFVMETTVDWDRFLLGDYHHHEREEVAGVPAEYCGSTERVSTEERAARGYSVIEVDDGEVSAARRSIPTRDFVFVEVDLAADGGDATDDVIARSEEYDVEDAVVIVDVAGAAEPTVIQSEVEGAVRDRGATVVRVNDRRDAPEDDDDRVEVSFVDPDEAVRERLDNVRLSDAGHRVDELVRGDRVPDSNVADEVESAIGELVEEERDGAFERPDEPATTEQEEESAAADVETSAAGEGETEPSEETTRATTDGARGEDAVQTLGGEGNRGGDGETETEAATVEDAGPRDGDAEDAAVAEEDDAEPSEPDDEKAESEPEREEEKKTKDELEEEKDKEPDEPEVDQPEVAGQSSMGDWT